jgi:hypothetical protein
LIRHLNSFCGLHRQPVYAIPIGRDILRNWKVTFNGRMKKIVIED